MQDLSPFKGDEPGVNDLLNWAAPIRDGIVQGKDGSLLAGWWFRGPDVASSTTGERNALCERVNDALMRFGGGWAIWVDASRTDAAGYPAPEESHFPDDISRLIDDERRAQFEAEGRHFDSDYALIAQYTPPLRRNSRILDIIYDEHPDDRKSPAATILAQFDKDLAAIEDAVGDAVKLRRMRGFRIPVGDREYLSDELVNYLHYCLNNDPSVALKLPESGGYLDTIIGLKHLWVSDTPLYGDEYISVIRLQGFPEESFPQILAALDQFQICYRWSTRFIAVDRHEAVTELKKYHRKWKQRIRGFVAQMFNTQGGVINEDAADMAQEAQSAIKLANGVQVKYGFHTPVVVLRNTDHSFLMECARAVRQAISNLGFAAELEDFNTVEAWLGSLPGHPVPNVRRPLEHTHNLANLLPLTSVWPGSPVHPNPLYPPNSPALFQASAAGGTPFRDSLHYGDNGSLLLFGPPGAGKSTALAFFALSHRRYPGSTVCVLDTGRSLKTPCQAVGGLHYEIAGEGSPSFCPLGALDTETERAEAGDWIATCFELQLSRPPLPHHRDAIHRALVLLSQDRNRSITHFIATVQDQEVREAMSYYSLAGPMGHLYDAERDGLSDHPFVVHEMSDLMALKPVASIPAILHIFRRFHRQLKGQPAMLIIDEAWIAFQSEVMTEKLRAELKGFRKLCCQLIMATHSLGDTFHTRLFSVIVSSCPYKILLADPDAGVEGTPTNPGPRDMYAALGLNPVEIDIVRYARPKRDLYVRCPEGRRLIDLGLGPIALAFCGVSDPKDLARVARLQQIYGDQWPHKWIRERRGIEETFAMAAE